MKRRQPGTGPLVIAVVSFTAGVLVDSALRTFGPPQPVDAPTAMAATPTTPPSPGPVPAELERALPAAAPAMSAPIAPTATTGSTSFQLPIEGMSVDAVKGGFYERRGNHPHEAVDILAARNTPIHAVENGTIARLFFSKQGGLTIYQFDPSGRLCYYYAHLEKYADGLHEGDTLREGQVIGYVGTSGNAPPNTPHLHFAVFELSGDRKWWKGQAIDPYPFLKRRGNG